MKKFGLSISFVFIMLSVMSTILRAESLTPIQLPPEIEKNIDVYGKLENLETGEKIYFTPSVVEFKQAPTDTNDSFETSNLITYEVGIPGQLLGSEFSSNNEQLFLSPNDPKYKCDSTSGVCATLTFYFHDGMVGLDEWMYMDKVTTIWYKYDSSISWTNGKIRAQCQANWFDRGGNCSDTVQGSISNPNSGDTYTITPWFAGSNNKTLVNEINYQVVSQSIDLHRGVNNWNFSFCIVNGGGNVVYGCY